MRPLFLSALVLLNLVLLFRVLWTDQGVFAYRELDARHEAMTREVAEIKEHNLRLSQEIRLLTTDERYIEQTVREHMHFVKANEILYAFPHHANAPQAGSATDER